MSFTAFSSGRRHRYHLHRNQICILITKRSNGRMKKISELILYKDHHLLALNKPAGIPSQQDPTEDTSAHRMAMAYAHRDLYLVHRLDRRVSGVLLFAKTKTDAAHLAKQWEAKKV